MHTMNTQTIIALIPQYAGNEDLLEGMIEDGLIRLGLSGYARMAFWNAVNNAAARGEDWRVAAKRQLEGMGRGSNG